MPKIVKLDWITEQNARKLKSCGIVTTQDLINRGKDRRELQRVAQQAGLQPREIRKWVDRAKIYRVRGVGDRYGGLLNATGVNSLNKLARHKPQTLHKRLAQRNSALNLVRKLPSQSQVGDWVVQARDLAGDISTGDEL